MRSQNGARPEVDDSSRFVSDNSALTHTPIDARILPEGKQLALRGTGMPTYKAKWSLGGELDRYQQTLLARGLSEGTVHSELWALGYMTDELYSAGFDINPRRTGQSQVDYLEKVIYKDCLQSTKAWYLSIFRQFLEWAKNKQTDGIRWPYRGYARTNADWLSDEQAQYVRLNGQGIERILVHCELDLGMRRVEVLRLKVDDFRTGRDSNISILGKGRHGGKPREIGWHEDTASELKSYLRLRDAEIAIARLSNPSVEVPPNLLIYATTNGGLKAYKRGALDNIVRGLSGRLKIKFSHHTMRRTCGRMMYFAGVRIEEIANFLGHSDTRTTLLYLGLKAQDTTNALERLAQYQKAVKIPENGIFGTSQQNSGPCGI